MIALLLLSVGVSVVAAQDNGIIERVNVSSDGNPGIDHIWNYSISYDGRYVAFDARGNNLVPGDTNDSDDIFVRDRSSSTTTRVSVTSEGKQANGGSHNPDINSDGRYVAFESWASNLVAGDTNSCTDIFVRGMHDYNTAIVSIGINGTQSNGDSMDPSISDDGRYIAFCSRASNLVPDDTNNLEDIFVRDRYTNTTVRVSLNSNGGQLFQSLHPSISGDGKHVVFETQWGSDWRQIVARNMSTNTTVPVSVTSDGGVGNGDSYNPMMGSDGRYIVFWSYASNLVPNDTNDGADVFVYDLRTKTNTLVSAPFDDMKCDGGVHSSMDDSGRYVAFNGPEGDIFIRDTQTNETAEIRYAPTNSF